MIDLSRTRRELLAEIEAPDAPGEPLSDITDPRVAATDAPRYPPVNCTGDDGRPMFTNVGRFLFAVPSAYETQLPKVGWSNCRPR